ncbi:helix-turn-helix domain-containing protein [Amycolatopsis pithecellobii]|uniref:helix-turn-helix domain-containing protein n=1 Tax=Amycolatopsis pithecellobii TaxID=664692 RepID=UPI001AA09CBE|nr:helix-turn-helix domain-containing protein [Amycolatopsis pithecellobii]
MPAPNRTATAATTELGRRVRAQRKKLELTQQDLAHSAGLTISWLSGLERGKRKRVELPGILALAEALEMDAGDLLQGLKADPQR